MEKIICCTLWIESRHGPHPFARKTKCDECKLDIVCFQKSLDMRQEGFRLLCNPCFNAILPSSGLTIFAGRIGVNGIRGL